MHLAIDAVGMKQGGVKTILLDVLREVEACEDIDRATVFTSPGESRSFEFPPSSRIRESPQPRAEKPLFRFWWYERELPKRVREEGADVLLCLHDAGLSPARVPHATFVQRPILYSDEARELVPRAARARMAVIRAAIGRSCRSAGRVFVHTPTERQRISSRFSIPEDRITVTLPPPRPLPDSPAPWPALEPMLGTPADRRVLFVGQLFAHKNLAVAVAAMARVRQRLPDATLFVSGPLDEQPPGSEGVVYLGAVPDMSLLEAYRRATVLVLPSLHETIGLPMLEAMSAGTPVLAADRPYAHDVCGAAAEFFDPLSTDDCAAAILRVLEDADLRKRLVREGYAVTERLQEAHPYRTMLSQTLALAAPV